jgi:uncharacterized protein with NAD-binding domain and iron-sulfur cluster
MPGQREKIAILGGGAAALAAAYELTLADDWSDRYEITVYQAGWRLGGKGASGRNPDVHQRIQEHGLHVWPGFYDNAFRMMRDCYQKLDRPAGVPIRAWDQAFQPHDDLAVEEFVNGTSEHWRYCAARRPGKPGDPRGLPALWELAAHVLDSARVAIGQFDAELPAPLDDEYFAPFTVLPWTLQAQAGLAPPPELDTLVTDTVGLMRNPVPGPLPVLGSDLLDHALGAVHAWLDDRENAMAEGDSTLRHLWIYVDLATTSLRGMAADGVFLHGLDPLDTEDFRAWLERHGASRVTIDSALIRGLYGFVFAEVGGQPNLGAGAAIRLSLRTGFGYQGAIMYKMRAGMGDAVFAPLYEYLQRRGVVFQFFHRVRKLTLSADGTDVATIEIGRQATLKGNSYDPLVPVLGLPCWPDRPRYDQLVEGNELAQRNIDLESCWSGWADVENRVLTRGVDFDRVVLAISLAALPQICADLASRQERWRTLLAELPTVATGAAQIWWTCSLANLGWTGASPVLTAFKLPFDTFADMSQTLAAEDWGAGGAPQTAAYVCGTLSDPPVIPPAGTASGFPGAQHGALLAAIKAWLEQHAPRLWPAIVDPATGQIRWELLHAGPGTAGDARLGAQYWRVNFEPSDRYVQSPAGSLESRLRPSESGFRNLVLAGDWTRNGINVGCVEAAVMSGMRAARVIKGDATPLPGEQDGVWL